MIEESAARVALATRAMDEAGGPLPIAVVSRISSCSARQLQRDFSETLGISPRQYGQEVRARRAATSLRSGLPVLDAVQDAGYGSVRSFYEQAASRLGMTPSEYASGAPGRTLLWSVTSSEVGDVCAVATPRGLAFVRIGERDLLEQEMQDEFPQAGFERDDAAMDQVMRALRQLADGREAPWLPVDARATAFQARVWAALREIPRGTTSTYTAVAAAIGSPTSVRAVARACATNPVALAIPCHRVVRSDGSLAGYRWGLEVKRELLRREQSA